MTRGRIRRGTKHDVVNVKSQLSAHTDIRTHPDEKDKRTGGGNGDVRPSRRRFVDNASI